MSEFETLTKEQQERFRALKNESVKVSDDNITNMHSLLCVAISTTVRGNSITHAVRNRFAPYTLDQIKTLLVTNADILAPYHDRCVARFQADPTTRITTANPQIRDQVFNKTGGRCAYCGCDVVLDSLDPNDRMEIEHFIPRALGGEDHIDNLLPACKACNTEKANMTVGTYRWIVAFRKRYGTPFTAASVKAMIAVDDHLKLEIKPATFYFEELEMISKMAVLAKEILDNVKVKKMLSHMVGDLKGVVDMAEIKFKGTALDINIENKQPLINEYLFIK